MDRLDALRAFVTVADKQSFAEAARTLRISPTAASRAIAALEESLGAALLRRTTRAVSLTPEGAAYLERGRRALDELDDAARLLRGENAEPRGPLIITAPVVFGRMHVLPIAAELLRAHPQIDIRLMLSDRVVRLVDEGIDVAVRIADLSDSALVALQVAHVRRVLVASPQYLDRRGAPSDVAQLHDHDLIAFEGFAANSEWRFGAAGGPAIRLQPRLLTNSVDAVIEAAIDGLGIARTLNYQADHHVRAGRLAYVLPEFDTAPVPVTLLYQANRQGSPNVRAFIDQARAYFRTHVIGGDGP